MIRKYSRLRKAMAPKTGSRRSKFPEALPAGKRLPAKDGVIKQRFDEMKKLQAKGMSISGISRVLSMNRTTVRKYLSVEVLMRKSYREKGMIESYFNFIKQRMEEVPAIQLNTLWTELREQGYPGAYSNLSEALAYYDIRLGKKKACKKRPAHKGSFFKPSLAAMAFLAHEDRLSKEQKAIRFKLCRSSIVLKKTMSLVKEFRNMMQNRAGNELSGWIQEAKNSVVTELGTFAKGLLTDLKAVENAIRLPWSNGPVEGNVNKLKTIKCQMYGRAGFELLRKRLILKPD